LKVSELLDHFAPQPVIGPILPNPAPAAWNCHLIFRLTLTIFEVQCNQRKVMSSNRIVFLKWEIKWISPDGFYVLNWKYTVLLWNKSKWTLY
jgi:hypothetical protein